MSADRLREADRFIASDLFEGRYPGLRGGELAAQYIADQFALDGLEPAGDHGTFLQQVNFVGMKAIPAQTSFTFLPAPGAPAQLAPAKLTFGQDFVVSNQTLTPTASFTAPLVFVGYGITAPEFGWNDYARMGAVGALIIHRTDLASYGWDVVRNSNSNERTFLRDDTNPRLQAASWIQLDVARRLFQRSGLNLDTEFAAAGQRGFRAVPLPVKLDATVTSTVRPFQSPNVVAILPGESHFAHRPDQAVLYTAHYDHLGIVPGMPGDNIYNGAADNGTGVAIVLEMARAWKSAVDHGLTLPHSVLFSAVTAEEQGLLGSEYLGQHPPIPTSQIVLDINFDMLLPLGIQQEVNVNGAQRTDFYPTVQATAKRFGLAIVPDPRPEAGSYYRSDHFSLSRVGIPAFSIDAGTLYEGHDLYCLATPTSGRCS